jgi:hypothetical protein
MKKILMLSLFLSTTISLTGCAEMAYDSLQDAQLDRCKQRMEPDRSQCVRNNSTDYETYKKQREKM